MQFNPMDLLKNAQKLQEQIGSIQRKMEDVVVTGRSGGGMIEIDMNGRMDIVDVRIEPQVVDPNSIEVLEDLIQSAFSDVIEKVRSAINSEMGSLVSGLASGGPFENDSKET